MMRLDYAAILQTGVSAITAEKNFSRYREQLDKIGFHLIGTGKFVPVSKIIINGHGF